MNVLRLAAFTDDPSGGNPAGVVLLDDHPTDDVMLAVAAEVGYSETAFLAADGPRRYRIRYFAPKTEVSFCGHATVAAGVALADREGPGRFTVVLADGTEVPVDTTVADDGAATATLTSPPPMVDGVAEDVLDEALAALAWDRGDLAVDLSPAVAWAGASHLIVPAATRTRLAALDYDVPRLEALMLAQGWTTVDLVWRESTRVWHARNPFPVGGVVEDPATGAAAAAFGGWLRHLGVVEPPADVTVHQGIDMGRPSVLNVHVGRAGEGVRVGGQAVSLA